MNERQPVPLAFLRLRESHLQEIIAIEREAYPEPWARNMFRQEMRSTQSYFYSIFLEGGLIGYGGFWHLADEAHITSLTIRHDLRGNGYGRCALLYLLDVAARLGVYLATLEVRESNYAARKLYRSMGFEIVGCHRAYYATTNEDALVMAKDIRAPIRECRAVD